MEYIERDKALDKFIEGDGNDAFTEGYNFAVNEYREKIKAIEAADVQTVVCCKDCKYRKERHYEESGEKPYIKYECKFTKYSMSYNGFCSFGARMDGDTE